MSTGLNLSHDNTSGVTRERVRWEGPRGWGLGRREVARGGEARLRESQDLTVRTEGGEEGLPPRATRSQAQGWTLGLLRAGHRGDVLLEVSEPEHGTPTPGPAALALRFTPRGVPARVSSAVPELRLHHRGLPPQHGHRGPRRLDFQTAGVIPQGISDSPLLPRAPLVRQTLVQSERTPAPRRSAPRLPPLSVARACDRRPCAPPRGPRDNGTTERL